MQTVLCIAHHPNFPGKSSKQGHQCQGYEHVFLPCNSKSTEQEGLKQQLQFAEGYQPLTWKRKQCPGITGHVHHCCFWQAGGQLVCNWWYHILVTLAKVLPDLEVQISYGGFQCLTYPFASPQKPCRFGCQQPGWEGSRMARKPCQKQISCSSGVSITLFRR